MIYIDRNFDIVRRLVGLECVYHFLNQPLHWRYLKGKCVSRDRHHDRSDHSGYEIFSYGTHNSFLNELFFFDYIDDFIHEKGVCWHSIFTWISCRSLHWRCVLLEAIGHCGYLFLSVLFGDCSHSSEHYFCSEILQGVSAH